MNRKVVTTLGFAIAFQFLVLSGVYVNAALPLWLGKEVRISTVPVDPRSMFRGNYAQLRYEISEVAETEFSDSDPYMKQLRNGEVVYVSLQPGPDGLYQFTGASLEKPATGVFLRGRVASRYYSSDVRIKYGIEAFFAPKEKALALEDELRDGGIAVLMVSDSGKARLKEVVPE